MTKNEFIQKHLTEREPWDLRLKGIDFSSTAESSTTEKMNLRDLLYHVAWYEREMVEVLQLRALVGSPWWELSTDERNALILAEGQAVSALDAYLQEQKIYSELLALLNGLRDEELEDANFFRDMPSEWKPWEMIASNTYEHYPQHLQDI
jgi:hypothetical protein